MLGSNISQVEVLGISKHGFWILLDEETELFVSFLDFPWFRKATVEQFFVWKDLYRITSIGLNLMLIYMLTQFSIPKITRWFQTLA